MTGAGTAGAGAGQGKLRTYLGIAPGVGKTYDMLRDGRAQRRAGVDVVVGFLQRHPRPATAAQVAGLEVLNTAVTYQGTTFDELDVAAVIDRRPGLALVDELAHDNLTGADRGKRWEDVAELLANGIDVYTTLNVGNIESLGELVSQVTGVRVSEPVPDAFVRAGEVKLVDLAPGVLRRRLADGLVFPADQADLALARYFRQANLAGLRELVQLWLDDGVPDPAAAFRATRGIGETAEADLIAVGLKGVPADEWLIRYAARLAGLSGARLHGIYVRPMDLMDRPLRAQVKEDRRLLKELHGAFTEVRDDDPGSGLVRAARKAGAGQLVIGSQHRSRWSRLLAGSTVAKRVLSAAGDLPVQVVDVGRRPAATSTQAV
jgi:two-component system, OmpR family, sensor histidine kinase KdpD